MRQYYKAKHFPHLDMISFVVSGIRYFAFYPDFRLEEFSSIPSAAKAGATFVIEEISSVRHNSDFRNSALEYKIYSSNGELCNLISSHKWAIRFEVGYGSGYDKTAIKTFATDPLGKVNHLSDSGVLVTIMRAFKEVVQYESFQNYTLSKQISKLVKENEELKAQLATVLAK